MNKVKEKLEKIISRVEYVCFDFFDTVVHRKYSISYIKKQWAFKVVKELGICLSYDQLYQVRVDIENELSHEEYNYKKLYQEVYKRILMFEDVLIQMNEEDFVEYCYKFESNLEKEAIYIDEEIMECILYLTKRNKNLVCISDFYFFSPFIDECMRILNIRQYFDNIYVSSDYQKSKRSGELYKIVLQDLGKTPNLIAMIGDNYNSDFLMAKDNHINALYRKWKPSVFEPDLKSVFNIANKDDISVYGNYAYILYDFITELYNIIIRKDISDLFFLSREGELLKELFDYYLFINNQKIIRTHYLKVSRLSTFLPSLKKLEEEKFDSLFIQYKDLSIKSFLLNFNFEEEIMSQIINSLDLDSDKKIINFQNSHEFDLIKNNCYFKYNYEKSRIIQKNNLIEYIKSFDTDIQMNGFNIVDIGWKGTMQDNFFNLFEGKIQIKGFYLGMVDKGHYSSKNQKWGLVFTKYPLKNKYFSVLSFDYTWLERLLFASHASVCSYLLEPESNNVVPVLHEYEKERDMKTVILPIQTDVKNKFITLCDLCKNIVYTSPEFEKEVSRQHFKAIYLIDKKHLQIKRIMLSGHIENFGTFIYTDEDGNGSTNFDTNLKRKIIKAFNMIFKIIFKRNKLDLTNELFLARLYFLQCMLIEKERFSIFKFFLTKIIKSLVKNNF